MSLEITEVITPIDPGKETGTTKANSPHDFESYLPPVLDKAPKLWAL